MQSYKSLDKDCLVDIQLCCINKNMKSQIGVLNMATHDHVTPNIIGPETFDGTETKSNALNSRLFFYLCKESDAEFEKLLLHSHARWLSKGQVLNRIFILHKEIQHFLKDTKPDMHAKFSDVRFLIS